MLSDFILQEVLEEVSNSMIGIWDVKNRNYISRQLELHNRNDKYYFYSSLFSAT